MKKLYTLFCASALSLIGLQVNATNHPVAVGVNCSATPANTYCPTATAAVVGDSVTFILASGAHTVNSTGVPSGAAPMNSGTMTTPGTQYVYVITQPGTYVYICNIHGSSMTGTINAVASGIVENSTDLSTLAFPNPFQEKITVKYHGIQTIELFNVVGEKVKKIELSPIESKVEINFEGMPAGIYFYRTYNEGVIVETKKIVKSK